MTNEINDPIITDRLALSRAQHLKFHNNRLKSVSDDGNDVVSDWSESDRECCPLSDFESASNFDGTKPYDMSYDDDEVGQKLTLESMESENILRSNETLLLKTNDNNTNTAITYTSISNTAQQQKPKQQQISTISTKKPLIKIQRQYQQPLLPNRRIQTQQVSSRHLTANSHVLPQTTSLLRNRKTDTPNSTQVYLRRETTLTNASLNSQLIIESVLSPSSSFHSNEDNQNHQQYAASPSLSQASGTHHLVPRVYELKKIFVDDYDYGRLTDASAIKSTPSRNRQKWGTIVHPPFPLGYQHVSAEQVTQVVQRLASPSRCRDRHTPVQTQSKRYLSVKETEALVRKKKKEEIMNRFDLLYEYFLF